MTTKTIGVQGNKTIGGQGDRSAGRKQFEPFEHGSEAEVGGSVGGEGSTGNSSSANGGAKLEL